MERFVRTESLVGSLEKLRSAKILIIGIGGVGGHAAEAVVRCGAENVTFCDGDSVDVSNINRQIIALDSTVGMPKAEAMRKRALDINPDGSFDAITKFLTVNDINPANLDKYDYIADCIDNVSVKVALAEYADKSGKKLISCMSAGNKLDPSAFKVGDIFETRMCPLCRVIRTELKKKGVKKLKVVYSEEEPVIRTRTPASISFVPSAAGLLMASTIVKDILNGSDF